MSGFFRPLGADDPIAAWPTTEAGNTSEQLRLRLATLKEANWDVCRNTETARLLELFSAPRVLFDTRDERWAEGNSARIHPNYGNNFAVYRKVDLRTAEVLQSARKLLEAPGTFDRGIDILVRLAEEVRGRPFSYAENPMAVLEVVLRLSENYDAALAQLNFDLLEEPGGTAPA